MSIKIITIPVGSLKTNCYLVFNKESRKTIIIDPGDDAIYIQKIIADNNCIPLLVAATHGHFDHVLGATEIKLAYNIPFFVHKNDEFLINKAKSSAKYFLGTDNIVTPLVDKYIRSEEEILLGKEKIKLIETPGHTPGSISLYFPKSGVIFTGDTLFAEGAVGRTDFSYGSYNNLIMSLKTLFKLPIKTIVYPGHGEQTILLEEKKYHKF